MAQILRHANVTMTNANAEYSFDFSQGLGKIQFQCRTAFDIRYSYETGKVATPTAPYFTLKSGSVYSWNNLTAGRTKVYFACPSAGKVLEIEYI
ncbi:MAG TPA: hypothetical protein ENI76_10880 [Ignavibacteria bacterium]|nr:hypothetical protein [Ignavibacteria bacterium]